MLEFIQGVAIAVSIVGISYTVLMFVITSIVAAVRLGWKGE